MDHLAALSPRQSAISGFIHIMNRNAIVAQRPATKKRCLRHTRCIQLTAIVFCCARDLFFTKYRQLQIYQLFSRVAFRNIFLISRDQQINRYDFIAVYILGIVVNMYSKSTLA